MAHSIRILIVDDHQVVRTGLTQVLNDADGLDVIAEAASGEEAVYLAQKFRPDIAFLDLKMTGMGGIEATRLIVEAGNAGAVIGLSTFSEPEHIEAMRKAGAKGYLLKETLAEDIIAAARRVHAGDQIFPKIAEHHSAVPMPSQQAATPRLGDQQKRVLALMTKGLTNPEIAQHLDISRATVSYHVSAILRKLDVSNRSEAVAIAVRDHLTTSDDF